MTENSRVGKERLIAVKGMKIRTANPDSFNADDSLAIKQLRLRQIIAELKLPNPTAHDSLHYARPLYGLIPSLYSGRPLIQVRP